MRDRETRKGSEREIGENLLYKNIINPSTLNPFSFLVKIYSDPELDFFGSLTRD